ncbi:MAG: TPM domain-containing protein [Gammaproteobacteria bacterium]
MRVLKHLCTGRLALRRRFPQSVLEEIEAAIARTEMSHRGQLRVAIESALDIGPLVRGETARERAIEVFSVLGVWDTAEDSGVLIYVLIAEHDVEIVADRGYRHGVSDAEWRQACEAMESEFRAGRFGSGVVAGIERVATFMARCFPARDGDRDNELPDRPVVL